MKTVIIIPARYASSRYPGKPLARLRQPDGQAISLIEMTWRAAGRIKGVDAIYMATDDDRIAKEAVRLGGDVIMMSERCENGTARCAEAVTQLDETPDLVINLQGDAPLTPPWFVEALIERMKADPTVDVATPVLRCDRQAYDNFVTNRKNGRVGGTTAVFDQHGKALYFSKEVLPYIDPGKMSAPLPVFHHVYAYRPGALAAYAATDTCQLEPLEGLEQLRFLFNGTPIACVDVDARGRVFWEFNNPGDIARIEAALEQSA